MSRISEWLDRNSLYIALLAAWIATLGSLYFSEVRGFLPCDLCWYQRILMYPLAVVLVVGLLRKDEHLSLLVLPLSTLGVGIALYHYLLEKTDIFPPHACRSGVPCTLAWINWFGFITIPFLSLVAFSIITVMCIIAWQAGEPYDDQSQTRPWLPVAGVVAAVVVAFAVLFTMGNQSAVATELTPTRSQTASGAGELTGSELYTQACAACHGPAGEGVAGLGSSLVGAEFVEKSSDDELVAMIRTGRGLDDPQNQSGLVMPPSGGRPDLSDSQLHLIVQWMRTLAPQK